MLQQNGVRFFFQTMGEGMPEAVGKIFLKIIIFLLHHLLQHSGHAF